MEGHFVPDNEKIKKRNTNASEGEHEIREFSCNVRVSSKLLEETNYAIIAIYARKMRVITLDAIPRVC